MSQDQTLVDSLRAHYGAAARRAARGELAADAGSDAQEHQGSQERQRGCGPGGQECDPKFGAGTYDAAELEGLPAEAVAGSIGCANPVALAELTPGEVVLDLGSGDGIDVLLSARRVGPQGFAYGVDMTAEMLELARVNQAKAGALTRAQYAEALAQASFVDIDLADSHPVANGYWSVLVRARRP